MATATKKPAAKKPAAKKTVKKPPAKKPAATKPAKRVELQAVEGSEWVPVKHPDDLTAYPVGTAFHFFEELGGTQSLHKLWIKVAPDSWATGFSYTERDAWKHLVSAITSGTYRLTDSKLRLIKFMVLSEGYKVRQYVLP